MSTRFARETRIEQIKIWIEQVARLSDLDSLIEPDEGEAFTVDKDHGGPPGEVVIKLRHKSGLIEHWKRGHRGWYVAKTEQPS